jgi:hypothetical protein
LAQYTTPVPQSVEASSGVAITALHLTFQLADGTQSDVLRTLPESDATWVHMAIPLSALPFPSTATDNAQLKGLIVAADGPATLYLGEIRLIDDNTPITVSPLDEQDVATGDVVTLQGDGDGGASALKYSWDFDTQGTFVDHAEGQTVTHRYTKPGDYKVTLTVSDLDGIKKQAVMTTTMRVED